MAERINVSKAMSWGGVAVKVCTYLLAAIGFVYTLGMTMGASDADDRNARLRQEQRDAQQDQQIAELKALVSEQTRATNALAREVSQLVGEIRAVRPRGG